MTAVIRTAITLSGLLAVAFLTVGFGDELRETLRGVADSSLALLIPFLVFAATLAALTSPATALVPNILGLAMMFLALAEGEGTGAGYAGIACVLVMSGLLILRMRGDEPA